MSFTPQQRQVDYALRCAKEAFEKASPQTHRIFFMALPTERSDMSETLYVTDAEHCPKQTAKVLHNIASFLSPQS